ncbi:MAG: hypothetical protein A3B99_01085 [Candidatus Yanofskybacteria bacterium RIFCSPHIGHO2_02_FULL_44_12b]|uniref:Sigma-54 factor interaction domain-containing protein n=2 Tax=Candidatus Yanofskyibacteriota TaxID=1752733 RepID=A0A1F8GJB4_9BACT|nr:MAG: hypothetical protein A2659_03750 [Candidatus Yanofskybacteria bacterium RIFCSPHIGHO2_01_FULL_44_24]OGN15427.1 MAG: hypothetical protein A3B99_01085 [Candidatus Yanofskybacteria bacterium RIFCSPHIGHO2_02_FULL_44_12b]OGN25411.1 MAG: hypothetical protein A2925_00050 [Candidatus Yanofskybacteria bacterium RIFCSPLOWO2_01_FULL_44_22]
MDFNPNKSSIYDAVVFYRIFPGGLMKLYRVLLFGIGFVSLGFWGIKKFFSILANFNFVPSVNPDGLLGIALIFLPIGFAVLFFELFGEYHLKNPKAEAGDNLADILDYHSARILSEASLAARLSKHSAIPLRAFLYRVFGDKFFRDIIFRIIPDAGIIQEFKNKLSDNERKDIPFNYISAYLPISEDLRWTVEEADKIRASHRGEKITVLDILAAAFDHDNDFKELIFAQDLDRNDLEELANWFEHIWSFRQNNRRFWLLENLVRKAPIGRGWIYGYSPYLNSFAKNLTDQSETSFQPFKLVSRDKEIRQIEEVLARSGENNIIIVGEEGVGKERLIADFVDLIAKGRALPQLNYKKVFDLNIPLMMSSSKDISGVQNILIQLLNEATRSGNIILIIKDLHNFIGEIGGMGRADISEIIVPYLKSTHIQVIATTNSANFHKFIENRSEIANAFERIDVDEATSDQTLKILEEIVPQTESRLGIIVTYGAIKNIIESADKYIRTSPFPEKAVDLLSEAVSYAVNKKEKVLMSQHVNEVVSRKTGIPLGPIAEEEKTKLENLESLMHKQLVGQDRAVEVVASTMRRLRTGLGKRGKPAGVFLFVGPTGVGKTLTAKILATTYYGAVDRMIRFDMSEYQDIESLDRFLGNLRTNEPGQFVSTVRDNPFSLILLDEIEKSHKNILNIFLQVFDEARLTDVFGRKVNFEQNIIIATSNAGAEQIREMVKSGLDPSLEKEKVVDILIRQNYFSPEFLNRFDEIVVFRPLTKEQIGDIARILIEALTKQLENKGYIFKPTEDIIRYISEIGFDPQFGARPMQRVIKDRIENAIAKKILDKSIKKGQEFGLTIEDIK